MYIKIIELSNINCLMLYINSIIYLLFVINISFKNYTSNIIMLIHFY